ncbi:hypothetical protein KO481_40010 [Nocardia sp. NEAU-G5]|uniref:Uncharacterized protein n=1 Tax=Nocardia albiluteola TaxID=2842303 RepID=A0ABS6BBL4_9NOCA|nr:hypothetical protein [Nocardia albiluteola]MBU3067692.1 hypothetical protein [Nocardia albiluteola]
MPALRLQGIAHARNNTPPPVLRHTLYILHALERNNDYENDDTYMYGGPAFEIELNARLLGRQLAGHDSDRD